MAKTIWKYPILVQDYFEIAMPIGAQILTVQMQNGVPCIWVVVKSGIDVASENRRFTVHGTGHPVGENEKYIGTFQMANGALVFHTFEVT